MSNSIDDRSTDGQSSTGLKVDRRRPRSGRVGERRQVDCVERVRLPDPIEHVGMLEQRGDGSTGRRNGVVSQRVVADPRPRSARLLRSNFTGRFEHDHPIIGPVAADIARLTHDKINSAGTRHTRRNRLQLGPMSLRLRVPEPSLARTHIETDDLRRVIPAKTTTVAGSGNVHSIRAQAAVPIATRRRQRRARPNLRPGPHVEPVHMAVGAGARRVDVIDTPISDQQSGVGVRHRVALLPASTQSLPMGAAVVEVVAVV